MDVHLHGACMGKLVGPAGGGGGGGGPGPGVSTQFRVMPNGLPSDCISTDWDRIHAVGHFPSLTLRVATPSPHRTFSPEPLKISDEFISSGSNSPAQDALNGFLLHDIPAGVRRPSLTPTTSGNALSKLLDKKPAARLQDDGDVPEVLGAAGSFVLN
ncbi:hypothetical protein MPTK1_1g11290 [Marchantia polymorpha subsp. ruderalis]|uniref:Uncharacterized protein n=2 Tax=Marchantia polymorpha TaxID=3197 RepID=A0AAF6ANY9_MARPO|nr:hypothetical protein MARPO_0014s0098 [Marchantia polymorpha]BBM98159.1 hypothetical protein Mp_1g11290 [Marchantia polymorpha subsp. ruderalis]|eukprot:PTQ45566.1 hypothetical protein MARPO_0014s0098 [Marchantia polymorpha]